MSQAGKPKSSSTTDASLGSLLRYMEGIEIIVELKTGKRIRGMLESSDDYMNLTLDHAEEEGQSNKEDFSSNKDATDDTNEILTSLNIRGSNIRYIHFPDNADLTSLVRTGAERERSAANKYKRGMRK
jgi:small nuclear ribonucleoprotein (snRNP)-like protein